MVPPEKTRDLARSLVAFETEASTTARKPNLQLCASMRGCAGNSAQPWELTVFRRSLPVPWLWPSRNHPGSARCRLRRMESCAVSAELNPRTDADEDGEAGIILIAQMLGLFLTFLGEATTLRLIEDLRLQVDVGTEAAVNTEDTPASAADGLVMAAAFEDLLLEIDRLRSVSDRIETLADKHPGMEDGLVSVAGNIRNIATVLDVFTLIRSKAGGPQEEIPGLETNRYMN